MKHHSKTAVKGLVRADHSVRGYLIDMVMYLPFELLFFAKVGIVIDGFY